MLCFCLPPFKCAGTEEEKLVQKRKPSPRERLVHKWWFCNDVTHEPSVTLVLASAQTVQVLNYLSNVSQNVQRE